MKPEMLEAASRIFALGSPETMKLAAELYRHDPVFNPSPAVKLLGERIASDARTMELIDQAITNRHKPKKD